MRRGHGGPPGGRAGAGPVWERVSLALLTKCSSGGDASTATASILGDGDHASA